jgi:ATP-dependent Clp protease ATP-binding subunit ClpC
LKKSIDSRLLQLADNDSGLGELENISIYKTTERVLKIVILEARSLKNDTINTAHLLLAILKDETSYITQLLLEHDIEYNSVRKYLTTEDSGDKDDFPGGGSEDDEGDSGIFGNMGRSGQGSSKSSDTPVLDNFGIDLTKSAEEGRLDPIIGREREIERIAQILSRRKKNNPILIGEPGVGKSAIAEGLALRIAKKKVSGCCSTNA